MPESSEWPAFLMAKDDKVGIAESPNEGTEREEVRSWLSTISKVEKERDDIGSKAGWKRYIEEYKNEWGFLQNMVKIPIIPINLIYAYVKTEIARLYFRNPWITVNPKRKEDIGASQIAEQIINYAWDELNLKMEIKKVLLESILVGHSWIKVGYTAEIGSEDATVESQPSEKRGPGRPKKSDKVSEIATSEYIKAENVFAYHVPYKDIIFDPSATFPPTHNARWMAHRIVKPIRAIKESGIYEHTDDLKTSSPLDNVDSGFDTSKGSKTSLGQEVRSATLWEIYDLDHMKIRTVSPGVDKYLNEIDYPKHLAGGFPFSMLAFNPVPGETFPLSDVAAQEGLTIEMTKIVAIWINHLKRHNRQIIVSPDLFTPDEKAKFTDGNDGAVIEGQVGANGGLSDKYFVPQYPPVQSDSYQIYNEVYKLHQIVSGQTPADQGGQARVPTRTLGELRLQMMGGHARAEEKVDVLEDFIAEIARKLLGIMQKKYDLLKITRIVGPQAIQQKILKSLPQRPSAQAQLPGGQPNPVQSQSFDTDFSFSWNRQDILGDMDVDVVAGSTVPMDKESNLEVMERLIPMLPAAGISPGSPAAKQYAREMFRMIGNQSLEAIMDLVDQQPPSPPPKVMEIMSKIKGKEEETKAKLQGMKAQTDIKTKGMLAQQQMKLQAQQQKLGLDKQKSDIDIHKKVIDMALQSIRSRASVEGNGNGNSER